MSYCEESTFSTLTYFHISNTHVQILKEHVRYAHVLSNTKEHIRYAHMLIYSSTFASLTYSYATLMESSAGVRLGVDGSLTLDNLPLLGRQGRSHGRKTVGSQHLAPNHLLGRLLQSLGEGNSSVSDIKQSLGAGLSVCDSGGSLRAQRQQTGHSLLIEKGGLGVCSSVVPLPVGVFGNVVGGVGRGVLVDVGLGSRSGSGDSVEGDDGVTGGSVGGNGEENSEFFPDALGAYGVFLG